MKTTSQYRLLKKRRFLPFFITQFLGALNDNVFKNAISILVVYQAVAWSHLSPQVLVPIFSALFILPFFLFSATAGQIADRYEKAKLIRIIKFAEILIMLLAAIGFIRHDLYFLMFVLFLTGIQAAFFGPLKYSIVPQHLRETELVGGNGLIEMGTFVAILVGTLLGGTLVNLPKQGVLYVSLFLFAVAIFGWLTSFKIPRAKAGDPDLKINWNPVSQTKKTINYARKNRTVFLSILGNSWFWFFGVMIVIQIPEYCKIILGGNAHVVTILLAAFSVGIGLGSLLCERLSRNKIEIGLVPFGAIGITVLLIDMYFAHPHPHVGELIGISGFFQSWDNIRIIFDAVILGMFGGFYIVPLYALIQQRSEPAHRSRIIAANNIINALWMSLASLYCIFILKIGFSIPQLFLITGILNALVAFYIFTLVPEFLFRFVVWLLISTIYRVKAKDVELNIPDEEPAVIVCNHVSFVDGLILLASIRRPIRFVMDKQIFKIPILSFLFKTSQAIPIAPYKKDPACMGKAFLRIKDELAHGNLVGIFPEGFITKDGNIQTFKSGIERIIKENPVPVIPVALRGIWGSIFSRKYKGIKRLLPRKFWSKIELVVGDPVPPEKATKEYLQQVVTELRGELA